nr:MAG TPA: dUTPase [Caudoviricetes sp.]
MTVRVGKFEKISLEQWHKDYGDDSEGYGDKIFKEIIKIPTRATKKSAGYDIVTPYDIDLNPGEMVKFPTGLRCKIENGWFLGIFPKSGLGFKYSLRLSNSTGVIDEDYYNSDNEGHFWVKIQNDGNQKIHIEKGKAVCQGIFLPYGLTYDDNADGIRNGGLGSTNA